jgi:ubiquitin-conjugating enzyme E2 O
MKKRSGCKKVDDASGNKACGGFSDLSWVGHITGLRNGDIEVTWADGMVSTVYFLPNNIISFFLFILSL